MQIIFYNTSDEPIVVNKNLSNQYTMTGNLKNECSIINPVILVEGNITSYNYCYIPEFNRYYFITNVTIIRDNLFQIELRIDVLYTYRNNIKSLNAVIEKQQNSSIDMYIDDGTYRFQNKITNEIKTFPNGFNDNPDYILITAGGIV